MENDDRKKKLEFLLERQKAKRKADYRVLFDECIEALGDGVTICSEIMSKELYDLFQQQIPFTQWSRINWNLIKNKFEVKNLEEVSDLFHQEEFEIFWSYGKFPVLKTNYENILRAFSDITAVSPDTFLYVPKKYVIEIFHNGEITLGYL